MNKRNTIKQLLHRGCLLMGISAITSSAFAWDFAEHRKIGDRAMSLLPRYLVENGSFPNEAVADSALLQILNMSHMPGSNAYAMNELTQLPNIVTYGTLCGLAGVVVDFCLFLESGVVFVVWLFCVCVGLLGCFLGFGVVGVGVLCGIFYLVCEVSQKYPSVKPAACQLPFQGSL